TLVIPCGLAGAFEPAAAWNGGGIVETEGEQHGLLEPLLRLPSAIPFLGHAQFAFVEAVKRALDRVANLARGIRSDILALVPGRIDDRLELLGVHGVVVPMTDGPLAGPNMGQGQRGVNVVDR